MAFRQLVNNNFPVPPMHYRPAATPPVTACLAQQFVTVFRITDGSYFSATIQQKKSYFAGGKFYLGIFIGFGHQNGSGSRGPDNLSASARVQIKTADVTSFGNNSSGHEYSVHKPQEQHIAAHWFQYSAPVAVNARLRITWCGSTA